MLSLRPSSPITPLASPALTRGGPDRVWVVGRRTLMIAALAFAVLSLWASAATWFIVFRDEALARFMERQGAMQYAYEERVSALRARLDRVATQKLLEQDGVETRLADLAGRQVALESRQAMLMGLAEQAGGAGDDSGGWGGAWPARDARAVPSAMPYAPMPAPAPAPPPTPEALGLRTEAETVAPGPSLSAAPSPGVTLRMATLAHALDGLEARQSLAVGRLAASSRSEAARLREVVAETGLDARRFAAIRGGGIGGPLVPAEAGPFESAVLLAQRDLGERDSLRKIVGALPLRRPMATDHGLSSTFGYRADPFTRGLAVHTGIDLRGEYGAPARATAAGTVTQAEYSGGYGNMVEVDHGHGLVTRYAHLSAIAVAPGQAVAAGQTVGRVGSTGRSTGTHLHYETRIDGEPVDPQRFLRAGARLAAR
ncbi:M23 family metallopeptidase [Methylobacterium sp. 17Sr1-1]|uniref:M23 family metallopeptidase n=1 Tax=Methylobacterium sp. 17Sr1-1 TaxID=2202826 RepID=UPI000D6FF1BF|nr:M23 family metallopeptidase [Methylobacterium sp. 17Sr1-1]AWN51425.1 peptidase M23 [Methylobacterium sp. 17Sr1-1]